ncbi:MAG: hydrogenase [Lentisphaerae bacterium]|nr:hydrogenase [Lentisphaerota bacterium]
MNALTLLLMAIALLGFSGLPACLLPARSAGGQRVTTGLMVCGGLLGLVGVVCARVAAPAPALSLAWGFQHSRFSVAVDPISVLFLLPIFLIPMLGSVYGLGYWRQAEHPANGCRLGLAYGLLAGAMALVVIARDGLLFLVAWEVMALAAYFAASAEDDKVEVRRAGWIYLIATHIGTLCLLALFALWRQATGSFALTAGAAIPSEAAGTLFLLAAIGFGFKAGLMPLHVWLPGAHANAPSHVSAVMSGVMLKMGVYGIVRMTALLPAPAPWWGPVLLAAGAFSSLTGIAFAIGQRDLKRMLAYSSIENLGIIAMGLGLALLGRAQGHAEWVLLGLGGALFHVWNHSLFKSLLFFNAGAIIHATETREIDRMGGLAKRLPVVMVLFVVAAAAICALPPLNGFAGEWVLYIGLFRTLGLGDAPGAPAAALAAVALAMTGALAVACFVKALGAVFLGAPRSASPRHVHQPGVAMVAPMVLLAVACVLIGLCPRLITPLLDAAVGAWSGQSQPLSTASVVPLKALACAGGALVGLLAAWALVLKANRRAKPVRTGLTWDCGYAAPTGRMEYTGSSFGDSLVKLTVFLLWPKKNQPALHGLFPKRSRFKIIVPDTVLDRLVTPLFRATGRFLPWLRVLQRGQTHVYVLYILVVVIVLLIWGNLER